MILATRGALLQVAATGKKGLTTTASRSFVTARVAQRLTSQVTVWRLAGSAVVLVGGVGVTSATGIAGSVKKDNGATNFVQVTSLLSLWSLPADTKKEEEEVGNTDQSTEDIDEGDELDSTGVFLATSAINDNGGSLWNRLFGGSNDDGGGKSKEEEESNEETETCQSGPGKRVLVNLDEELVQGLPEMSLAEVQKCTNSDKMLVTYEGIVYDVTQFVNDHPGGAEMIKTAAGLDLDHFFGNFTVHGQTDKAAQWLAPLAVGKLTPEEAIVARDSTTPEVHIRRRAKMLRETRKRIVVVAATLPFWMSLRQMISWIGWFIPPLGRLLARAMPVTVPGFTNGSEPLKISSQDEAVPKVAIIGGGIAGCSAAWALTQSGYQVILYEAREQISGNAKTFEWDFSPFRNEDTIVDTCVSVTAWPPIYYKNYTCMLDQLGVETVHQPLSWLLNSKVPGYEGQLWECDPEVYPGSLREIFKGDFARYHAVVEFSRRVTQLFTLRWAPWRWNDLPSMYDAHQGLGLLNPLTVVPLYSLYKWIGGSDAWWNIVFTPQYTASVLVDELRPFPAVFGPIIEDQIPLNPTPANTWKGPSVRSPNDCNITSCVTWKDAGKGLRQVFSLLVENVDLKEKTRVREVKVLPNGKKRVYDEFDNYVDVDRVIFACASNAVGNIYKDHSKLTFADTILSTPVYADDHHPSTGHMHAVVHSDGSVIPQEYREEALKRASNYVEVTQRPDGSINIENQYNFGVQTHEVYHLPLDQKPVMLIGHAMGEGKSYDPALIRGTGNHARAHPLYSGWNVMAQLSLRLIQGRDGIYYCSNWTTPGNCHDMSLLSGFICAHAIGAKYPFEQNKEARKDFHRMRDLMGF